MIAHWPRVDLGSGDAQEGLPVSAVWGLVAHTLESSAGDAGLGGSGGVSGEADAAPNII
jgi:hypothetical protein